MRLDGQPLPTVPQNAATAPTRNRLRRLSVWEEPLIGDASTTICTRSNFRAAPLFPNLDCNLCPTLTAHWEPMPCSELAETRVQASNPYLTRVLGWVCMCVYVLLCVRVCVSRCVCVCVCVCVCLMSPKQPFGGPLFTWHRPLQSLHCPLHFKSNKVRILHALTLLLQHFKDLVGPRYLDLF